MYPAAGDSQMRHDGAIVADTPLMNIPLIIAGVILWTLNILTSWSMIQAGYPQVVAFTATAALLFTLIVTRRRIARGAARLAASREASSTEQVKTPV
jgi:hypothetical protein